MVHKPAFRPDCSRRGSPLTSTQPSRRSMFNSISACQQAWGAGQRMEEGEAALSQPGRPAQSGAVTAGGSSSSQAQGTPCSLRLRRIFNAPGVASASAQGESLRAREPKSTRQPLRPNNTAVNEGAAATAISACGI
ncbi:hypothetical protein PFLmoz3_03523 [Pseudomonas fluorescens]|uniref:Uncharacterized protein n=1 Tax=Pseudomonas fluorescens TaxID=294 RepID=A0A120G767_PSEFL|nr:hypothetical protein PFLmoz3_03523 [Pseudomonas fluorescens]